MGIYTTAPSFRSTDEDKPTLLVCWWSTIFCTIIILLRIAGRFIRSERLFIEDKTVSLAIIPLFLRMGCVHVILKYGTNNADFSGITLSDTQIHHRSIGSGLVLASRILHTATLWILKIAILEFFRRINDALSGRFTRASLIIIRISLATTFIAIIISDIAECQPFSHYWQVLPDPGGQCRQGYAQLITMSACNIFTDLLLVFFPIPIILFSHQALKRRIQLVLLFSMSLGVVGITLYRLVRVIEAHGNQQLRSLLASVELLFATTAANALVLGSFIRDRGVKKNKFRNNSAIDSMERGSVARQRRPTMNHHWGSDEDLVRDLGLGVHPRLRSLPDPTRADNVIFSRRASNRDPRHVPAANGGDAQEGTDGNEEDSVGQANRASGDDNLENMNTWQFPERQRSSTGTQTQSACSGQSDDDALLKNPPSSSSQTTSTSTPRKVAFYDVSGLLGGDTSTEESTGQQSVASNRPESTYGTMSPSPVYPAGSHGFRRGSTALLQDLGGLLDPLTPHIRQKSLDKGTILPAPQESPLEYRPLSSPSSLSPSLSVSLSPHTALDDVVMGDPGGLLGQGTK